MATALELASATASPATAIDFQTFQDKLKGLPAKEKRNFSTAARVLLDNSAELLREVCISEGKNGLPLMKKENVDLSKLDFSSLAGHLVDKKRIQSPEQSGNFFKLVLGNVKFMSVQEGFQGSSENGLKYVLTTSTPIATDLANFGKHDYNAFVHRPGSNPFEARIELCPKTKPGEFVYFVSFYPNSATKSLLGQEVSVYRPTDAYLAVNALRVMRNGIDFFHSTSVGVEDSLLENLFEAAKDAHKKLKECSLITDDFTGKNLEDLEKIKTEHENMEDILLGRILLMKAYDDELFAKIEQVRDELKEKELMDAKRYEELQQQLKEMECAQARATKERKDLKEEIRTLAEERQGDVGFQNRFGGEGNTYYIHQHYNAPSTRSTQPLEDYSQTFDSANQDKYDGGPIFEPVIEFADNGKVCNVTIEGTTVLVPRVDPSVLDKLPKYKSMTVSASFIHEYADVGINLVLLAHDNVKKRLNKKQPEKPIEKPISQEPKKEVAVNENSRLKKHAVSLYRNDRPTCEILSKRNKKCKEGITGMVDHIIYKGGAQAVFMFTELVTLHDYKAFPEKTAKIYHRIQALLFAGEYQCCEYVQYSKDKDEICVHMIPPDENWQSTVLPRAKTYCKYFDFLWAKVLEINKTG